MRRFPSFLALAAILPSAALGQAGPVPITPSVKPSASAASSPARGPVTPASTAPQAVDAAPGGPVTVGLSRTISLKELGFGDGLTFKGLSGQQTLFFPIGAKSAASNLTLSLPFVTASALSARRTIEAQINGRPVAVAPLPTEVTHGVLEIPVTPEDIRDGFLTVVLKYAGVSTEDRCADERAGGDYLTFPATDGLHVALSPEFLGTLQAAAALAPPDVRIVLPPQPKASDLAAALTLAAGTKGKVVFGGEPSATGGAWNETIVVVGQGTDAVSVMSSAYGAPRFALGGADPSGGARLLTGAWRPLPRAAAVNGTGQAVVPREPRVTLRSLRTDLSARDVVGRADWTAAFSLKQLPPGTHPTSVKLKVVAPPDPSGGSVVSASLNGQVIATARASWPGLTDLTATLPKGLAAEDNSLIVSVLRQPRGGDCKFAPQGYPAQLMGDSALVLSNAPTPTDFNGLTAAYGQGVVVRLPSADAASLNRSLPLAALAVQRLVPAGVPVRVVFGNELLDGPYIAIGDVAPAGGKPPVRFDAGRVALSTAEGRPLFDLSGLNKLTTAQLVMAGKSPGLWLRPGPESIPPATLLLDRGDVAFVDQDGVSMAFSSTRDDLVDVRYPDQLSLMGWLSQHRVWIILGAWVLVTLFFLMFLQRLYRTRRDKAKS